MNSNNNETAEGASLSNVGLGQKQSLAAKVGYTPMLCWLGLHRWSVTCGMLDLQPDSDGLKWATTGYLCIRCGASKDVTTVAEWPNP
jgi:hypothetical protein